MPKSSPPRHARGLPQYQRDLKSWAGQPLKPTRVVEPELMHRARHAAPMGSRGRNALTAVGIAAGGLAAHAYRARNSEQTVGKGLVSIPLSQTSRGGAAGIKRLKGAAEEAAQATWKNKIGQSGGRMAKAYSPTTPYEGALRLRRTLMQSKESAQRAKVKPFKDGMRGDVPARGPMSEFNFGAGVKAHHSMMRQRGVSKAENVMTGTNVRRLTPRTPTGRFVSHENDLVYIQPRAFIGKRPSRDSKLQVWHKEGVGKAGWDMSLAAKPVRAALPKFGTAKPGGEKDFLNQVHRKKAIASSRRFAGQASSPTRRNFPAGHAPDPFGKGATWGEAKRFVKEGKRPIGRAEKERAAQASSPSLADTSRHTGARHGKRLV